MRHHKAGLKLNRTSSHRNAMFRNMVTSLFKHDRIRTTNTKAKELKRWADNLITLAKRGDLHARRRALSIVREKEVVHKLFSEVEDRFSDKAGGYTRVVRLGRRPGDAAPICLVELVSSETTGKKKKERKKKKTEPAKKKPAADKREADTIETEQKTEEKPSQPTDIKEASATAEASKKPEPPVSPEQDSTKADPES